MAVHPGPAARQVDSPEHREGREPSPPAPLAQLTLAAFLGAREGRRAPPEISSELTVLRNKPF